MIVEVRLFATLRNDRFKKKPFEYETGTTVRDIIEQLIIDEKDVAILLINGHDAAYDQCLSDGDALAIFPPVGGG